MRKARENHWRIPGSEQRPPGRREQVLRKISHALVTDTAVGLDPRQPAGADPYDNRTGASGGDVWGRRRRA